MKNCFDTYERYTENKIYQLKGNMKVVLLKQGFFFVGTLYIENIEPLS